jgi:hypothetical protein
VKSKIGAEKTASHLSQQGSHPNSEVCIIVYIYILWVVNARRKVAQKVRTGFASGDANA